MNRVKTFSYWMLSAAAVNIVGYFLVWLNNDSQIIVNILRGIIHGLSVFLASSVALNITINEKGTRRYLNGVNLLASLMWVLVGFAQIIAIIFLLRKDHSFSDLIKENPEAFRDISAGLAVSLASYRIFKNKEKIFL